MTVLGMVEQMGAAAAVRARPSKAPAPARGVVRVTAALLIGAIALGSPSTAAGDSRRLERLLDRARPSRPARPEAPPSGAGAIRERYRVNAQYRGAVTKGFDGVGEIAITHRPAVGSEFGLDLDATLRDPKRKKEDARFTASLRYTLADDRVSPVSDKNDFSAEAQKHREKILQNAPFIYLVRYLPVPSALPSERSFDVAGKAYRIRYARSDRHVEATVLDGPRWIGKFFLKKGSGPPNDYEKFRVSTKGDTVISFVLDRREPCGD